MSAHLESIDPARGRPLLSRTGLLQRVRQGVLWREVMFRVIAVLASSIFVWRASEAFLQDPARINLLLVVMSESLSAVLLVLSTAPKSRDFHPIAFVTVAWAYVYAGFFNVDPGTHLLGATTGATVCAIGLMLTIWGKVTIGTRFGLLPASRGVVRSGPYRFVRHPIYVGYFITHVGFLLSDFHWWNLAVLASLYLCQFVRVLREEKVLSQEEAYRAYCRDVPYRFCYGVC